MSPFKKLGLSDEMLTVLNEHGITTPTPIQTETIELISKGRDVIAEAQTGTGKTLAFLLPMFENMEASINKTQGVIITPTRELAIQITDEARKLNKNKRLKILAVYGGQDIRSQLQKLKSNAHLIIATPGRLIDHIQRKTIDLSELDTLVLDEADQMLQIGFQREVEFIISHTSETRQTLCFSATMSKAVNKLAYKHMKDPAVIAVKKKQITLDSITQYLIETTDRNKFSDLRKIIDEEKPFMAILFCRTKRRVDKLEDQLSVAGYNCNKLHGGMSQAQREKVMKSFKALKIQFLVATDVAARGLDIDGVTHIYNYDMPETPEGYIHRIGRTGRAGKEGISYLFSTEKNEDLLNAIHKTIRKKIPVKSLKDVVPSDSEFLFKGDDLFHADGTKRSKNKPTHKKVTYSSGRPKSASKGKSPEDKGSKGNYAGKGKPNSRKSASSSFSNRSSGSKNR